jgi:cation transport regulator ChaC
MSSGLSDYQIAYLKNREIKKAEIRAEKERKLNIKKTNIAYKIHASYIMGNGSRQFKRSLDTATHNSINDFLLRFHNTKK